MIYFQYDGKIAIHALLCETVSSAHAAMGQLCRSFQSSLLACETLPDHDSIVTLRGLLSMAANVAFRDPQDPSQSKAAIGVQSQKHFPRLSGRRSSGSMSPSRRSSTSSSTSADPAKDLSGGVLFYRDFDDVPLEQVVSNVQFLASERVFNKRSGLLDAQQLNLDPGDPFNMLTFASSNVDGDHALGGGAFDATHSSNHASAENRLLMHDAAACSLAKKALRRLCMRGGGLHRRIEDPGLKDFRLYLTAGYQKQEQLYRATFSNSTGMRELVSEGNIFAVTSIFNKTPHGIEMGQTSRTLQRSACEVALLHHLSVARRAFALVSKGKFLKALSACTHAMRSKSSDAVMSHLLDDALRFGCNKLTDTDAWNLHSRQAALEIHTFLVHIMATACANMGSFLSAIKLFASWIAAIHLDSQWWFSASLSSFQQLNPAHLIPQLPLPVRQQFVDSAKAVTAMHLMCGQFSNEVMSACLRSCSKQREQMRQNLHTNPMASSPTIESDMSASAHPATKFDVVDTRCRLANDCFVEQHVLCLCRSLFCFQI